MKTKKYLLLGSLSVLLITLSIILIPPLFSKTFSQNQFENSDNSITITQSDTPLQKLFTPSYIIFSTQNNQARANYVKLKRKYLILWQVEKTNYQAINTDTNLSKKEQEKQAAKNIDKLKDSIEEGRLSPEDFQGSSELSQLNEQALAESQAQTAPGTIRQEYSDPEGEISVQVVTADSPSSNKLTVNGESTGIENIMSAGLDFQNKYIYYSKYTLEILGEEFEILTSTGKIYRYNISAGSEEEFYDLNTDRAVGLKANDESVVYVIGNEEIGVIDIDSKDRRRKVITNLIDLAEYGGTDVELTLVSILDIGGDNAIISINRTIYPDDPQYDYYDLDINTLELEKTD